MKFIDVAKEQKSDYKVKEEGKHLFFIFNTSGKINIHIERESSEVYIYGLFVGKNTDNFHLETTQHHVVGNSFSDLLIKGVFYDESKFIYQGLIRIEKEAQKSHAYQKNQNLILSKKAFVDSRPFLEILANDVFCTHGSTTGKLHQEEIDYIRSRGIPEQTARKMLIEGFIDDMVKKIEDLGFGKEIHKYKKLLS